MDTVDSQGQIRFRNLFTGLENRNLGLNMFIRFAKMPNVNELMRFFPTRNV